VNGRRVFADRELVELLSDKSDLLAIADAIAAVGVSGSDDVPGGGSTSLEASDGQPAAGGRGRWLLRRPVLALVAAVFAVVVLAAPALAVSPKLRELVGLSSSRTPSRQLIVARLTGLTIHRAPRYALPLATVTFTVGEAGTPPGTGIPSGSVFDVSFVGKDASGPLVKAFGAHGRYRVTLRTPEGGIRNVLIGGFLNTTKGSPAANGDFWIPIVNVYTPE
jgi:hypothetical protein